MVDPAMGRFPLPLPGLVHVRNTIVMHRPVRADETLGLSARAVWHVPADLGRRYASVSGDVNPIHLSRLAARALGFRRALAHGMWTKASALAAIEPRLPDAYAVDVEFGKPLFLPSVVNLLVAQGNTDWDIEVRPRGRTGSHLRGIVRPL